MTDEGADLLFFVGLFLLFFPFYIHPIVNIVISVLGFILWIISGGIIAGKSTILLGGQTEQYTSGTEFDSDE
jgi:hypothetical protein